MRVESGILKVESGDWPAIFIRIWKLANYIYLEILVPYFDTASEEAASKNTKTDWQHETTYFYKRFKCLSKST